MSEPITGPWAASLPASAAQTIASLRLAPGMLAAFEGDLVWLRGDRYDDATRAAVHRVAPAALYAAAGDGLLTRAGERLPERRLPDVPWTPIAKFANARPPPSLLAGMVERTMPLTLAAADRATPSNGLLADLNSFAVWAHDAPDFRFTPLRYAVSGNRALIVGEPVPSIDGVRLYETDGVCVPCGFALSPPIDAASLRVVLSLDAADFALIEADRWHRIPGDVLLPVTRASVRLSAKRGRP